MVKENGTVMMSEMEYNELKSKDNEIELLMKEIVELRTALLKATRNKKMKTKDIRVSMATFYNLTQEILRHEDGDEIDMETDIYGHDVTVHFHGLYCNCQDGASCFNYVIEGVGGCAEECSEEDDALIEIWEEKYKTERR